MKHYLAIALLMILVMPMALADNEIPENDDELDVLLEPLFKVIRAIQYIASFVAIAFIGMAGLTFITSNGEVAKKEEAKRKATNAVIGLVVVWAAPMIVQYIV